MTPAQLQAALDRIGDRQLVRGMLVNFNGEHCVLGELLNGPEGFGTATLQEWDYTATDACEDGGRYVDKLPERAHAYLAEHYGLNLGQLADLVDLNDETEDAERLNQVRAYLTREVTP